MAVDPNIKNKATKIRNEIYGKDVREALASGLEAMSEDVVDNKNRQDSVEGRFQDVLDGTTDKDVISAPEILDARQGHSNLGQNLLSMKQELAQTDDKFGSLKNANAVHKLNIVNYLGNNQSMHPSVKHFSNKWKGYEYWMAYTAYPGGNVAYENPSIAVSSDGIDWITPAGLVNPIAPQPDTGEGITEYNSDTELVYRSDLDRLEVWYRYYNQTDNRSIIYRMTSTNGINWNPKEIMYDSRSTGIDIVSPSIVVEDGKYKMWGVAITGQHTNHLVYTERLFVGDWTPIVRKDVDWQGGRPWHGSTIKTSKGYEHIMSVYPNASSTRGDLYYFYSVDNITFSKPIKIMQVNDNNSAFDSGTLYRSSLLKVGDIYKLYYSARNNSSVWGTSLATGTDITALNGFFDGRLLDLSRVREIVFDNVNSQITNSLFRLYESSTEQVTLKTDPTANNTLLISDLSGNPKSVRTGYIALEKAQDITYVTWKEGMIRYNGLNKKHEGYTGSTWLTFDRFINSVPATRTSDGTKGDYAVDINYLYYCYSTNLWARIPKDTSWT